jgi:hypothetical protein
MAAKRAAGSKKSQRSTKTSGEQPGTKRTARPGTSRAHRKGTPEARVQRSRTAKTHPTHHPVASRKDKATGAR